MKIQVFKRTKDNWHGSYKIAGDARVSDLVEVSFTQTGPDPKNGKGEFRVCVWGNDDCGMERDFGDDEDKALNMFYQVIGMEYVNMIDLFTNKFGNA
jgi:hypothetical protein